ncbi:MAG TPA: hypothetical protein PLN21_09165 [Gemmatales bacterium]|nr:hypothetical protein [Gemmatales bacterium]
MLCQLLVSVLLLAPSTSRVDDKIDGKLLIGKWTPEKPPEGVDKVVIEYTKDNKMLVEIEVQGQKQNFEGTYKLDGDKLSFKIDIGGQERDEKRKILKLTENEMTTKDEEKNEERTMKKVK